MRTSRLEAFSDGVLAIIITIMVLELNVPHEPTLQALGGSGTGFLTYLLSFVYIGIYWNNHHHMFQVVERVNGTVLWGKPFGNPAHSTTAPSAGDLPHAPHPAAHRKRARVCLLYTSDAADDLLCVDLGGRRII